MKLIAPMILLATLLGAGPTFAEIYVNEKSLDEGISEILEMVMPGASDEDIAEELEILKGQLLNSLHGESARGDNFQPLEEEEGVETSIVPPLTIHCNHHHNTIPVYGECWEVWYCSIPGVLPFFKIMRPCTGES